MAYIRKRVLNKQNILNLYLPYSFDHLAEDFGLFKCNLALCDRL